MIIVDTTVWIDYLRGDSSPESLWLSRELVRRRIGLTDVILCEVLQGVADEGTAKSVQRELSKFAVWPMGGVRLAVSAARNYRTLRANGRTVRKTIDCWIATFCLDAGHELLHRDRDFEPFEKLLGLRVVKPD
jgi:predicted nucleic acid-binding protein